MDLLVAILGSFCGIIYIMYRYGQEELGDRWGCFKGVAVIFVAMFLIVGLPCLIADAIIDAGGSVTLMWIYFVFHVALVIFVLWKLWHKKN